MANLINLERVSKSYGVRPLLDDVSLGISVGERVGVVGRNGDGKTTLLEVMTGIEQPDAGRVSRTRGVEIGYLHQGDELVDSHSVREAVLGGREDHEWAADATTRQVVEELLAGVTLDRAVVGLSGGERRRCALAALLLSRHDLIVLDEPTNHLDVEAVAWLAAHLDQPAERADRGDPRPVVPRRGLPDHVGGPRRRGRLLRGRATPRTSWPRRSARARPPPRRRGGRTSPARSSPGCDAARRRVRRSRSSASTRPTPSSTTYRRRATGWSSSASPASGSARTSSTSRTSTSRAATRCCSSTPPGGSARATASASSASTAPARPRCCR